MAIPEKGKTSSFLYTNEWRPLPKYVVVHTKKFKKSKWKGIYRNRKLLRFRILRRELFHGAKWRLLKINMVTYAEDSSALCSIL